MNSLNRGGEQEIRELDKRIEDIVIDCVNFTDEDCEDGLVNEDGDSVIDVDWKLDFIEKKTKLILNLLGEAKAEEINRCLEATDKLMNENSLDNTQLVIDRQSWKNIKDQAISAINNKK